MNALVLESIHSHFCSFFEHVRFLLPGSTIPPFASQPSLFAPLPWLSKEEQQDLLPDALISSLRLAQLKHIDEEVIQRVAIDRALSVITHSRRQIANAKRHQIKQLLLPLLKGERGEAEVLLMADVECHPGTRTAEEMVGMAKAYRHLCMLHKDSSISETLIFETHALLMNAPSSFFRPADASIGAHLFPPSHSLSLSLTRIISSYYAKLDSANEPYSVAAWLMYEVLALHPFSDGNGRLSRLLLNWALLSQGVPFPAVFDSEHGSRKSNKSLQVAIQVALLNAGHPPAVLATRVLLSIANAYAICLFKKA